MILLVPSSPVFQGIFAVFDMKIPPEYSEFCFYSVYSRGSISNLLAGSRGEFLCLSAIEEQQLPIGHAVGIHGVADADLCVLRIEDRFPVNTAAAGLQV